MRRAIKLSGVSLRIGTDQLLRILHAACHAGDAACCLHCMNPLLLFWPDATCSTFYLDAGEYRHLLPDHLRRDRACGPADQIAAAFGQSEAHGSAVLIPQRAGVIAMQPHRAAAAAQADLLLYLLLAWHEMRG